MGLIVFIMLYLLPLAFCMWVIYRSIKDPLFAKDVCVNDWLKVAMVAVLSVIPVINVGAMVVLILIIYENEALGDGLKLHKGGK